jgi:hypothetical protein
MSWDAPYPEWPLPQRKDPLYQLFTQDADTFGGDAVQQNNALSNFIAPTVPDFNVRPPIVERDPFNPNSGIITDYFNEPTVPDFNVRPPIVERDPFNPNSGIATEEPFNLAELFKSGAEPAPTVPDVIPRVPGNQFVQEAGQTDQPITPVAAKPKDDNLDALVQQILGQGTTASWKGQGYGSAEANAREMAKILASAGITNINQVGMIDVPYDTQVRPDGRGGFVDLQGKPVDSSKVTAQDVSGESGTETVYTAPITTSKLLGNKETGQRIVSPFSTSEQTSPNLFGGTYEGKGATGFHVNFDAQGNPIFYTGDIAQNPLGDLSGPVGTMIVSAIGGPLAVAALGLASGKKPIDIIKSAALAYAGGMAGDAVSGMDGITDVLGKTGTDIASNVAKSVVGSGFKVDPVDALLSGLVNTGVNSAATSLGMGDLTPAQQKMLNVGINAAITGQPLDSALMSLAMAGAGSLSKGNPNTNTGPTENLTPDLDPDEQAQLIENRLNSVIARSQTPPEEQDENTRRAIEELKRMYGPAETDTLPSSTRSLSGTQVDDTDDFLKSIGINTIDKTPDSSLSNKDIEEIINGGNEVVVTGNLNKVPVSSPIDDYFRTITKDPDNELVMTANRPYALNPTIPDYIAPVDTVNDDELVMTANRPYALNPTIPDYIAPVDTVDEYNRDFDIDEINPKLPTVVPGISAPKAGAVKTPTKAPTAPKAPTAAKPAASSGMDLSSLLALLAASQQPQQQAPMQDPYAHIKLMEDLFGSTIDVNSNR